MIAFPSLDAIKFFCTQTNFSTMRNVSRLKRPRYWEKELNKRLSSSFYLVRLCSAPKFLIKMNSFAAACTQCELMVLWFSEQFFTFFPHSLSFGSFEDLSFCVRGVVCCACVHMISVLCLQSSSSKSSTSKTPTFSENNTQSTFTHSPSCVSLLLSLCMVLGVYDCMWRKLISDYSQMENVYTSEQSEYAFSSIRAVHFFFSVLVVSFTSSVWGRVRKHVCKWSRKC